ncbi:hypothetical protein [Actinoplanes sp. NPDC023714]|uniref:hypothetical protein n=1 Tax=Actinoplanes sp. NPDC023714 TaxID=3154322 RepID=UPI00340A3A4F
MPPASAPRIPAASGLSLALWAISYEGSTCSPWRRRSASRRRCRPAGRTRLGDRGRIAVGAAADLVVLDPDRIIDRSTYERPWQLATGVDTVLVNGVVAVDGGEITGARGGEVLRFTRP